jgi:acetylornithine deacetylase/succinyl-diaminopimelate desuccinylase-like protein
MHPLIAPAVLAATTLAATSLTATSLTAQPVRKDVTAPADPSRVATNAAVKQALASIQATNAWTLEQQTSVCEIPAPPFKEAARGAELKRRFEALGLRNVHTDAEGNVIAERPGTGGPTVMLSAHLDTVFPDGTDVRVKRDVTPDGGVRLTAPGIGDDCRGLAVILSVAKAMDAAKVSTAGRILFVATVGEEGPGNLRGVRRIFGGPMRDSIDYFISVDGDGLNVTSRAVGSARYKVTFAGPGGHSYGAFGMPNPAHAMGRAMARIADFQVPTTPKATFNVGIVSGGQTVNSIPAEMSMEVDLRSESPTELARLDRMLHAAVDSSVAEEKARYPRSTMALAATFHEIGIRPASAQTDDAPIVRTALAAGRALGFAPKSDASSTDANIAMSLGIPAITIDGGGRGVGAHSLSEYYDDTARGWLGPQWALLITASLAGVR